MSDIVISIKDGVKIIKLNRPQRKNAFNQTIYKSLKNILNEDAKDDKIVVTVLTGEGDYFSSGNDLKAALEVEPGEGLRNVFNMVEAFINYPKLIICVVNGIAIGIAATIAAVCDIVYASDKAVFDTPFLKLGVCLEGCSSFLYPITLGRSLTSEMIFLGRKLTAQEALHFGLVSKVIPHQELPAFIESLHQYGKLPVQNLIRNKSALMNNFKEILKRSNKNEMETLQKCVDSDEFSEGIIKFLNRKSKL